MAIFFPDLTHSGASANQCCYAAIGSCERSTVSNRESIGAGAAFRCSKKSAVDKKISLNISCFVANPACIAGFRTSLPNFRARCAYGPVIQPNSNLIVGRQLRSVEGQYLGRQVRHAKQDALHDIARGRLLREHVGKV